MNFVKFINQLNKKCKTDNLTMTIRIDGNDFLSPPYIFVNSAKYKSCKIIDNSEKLDSMLKTDYNAIFKKKREDELLEEIRTFGYLDEKFDNFFQPANRLDTPSADTKTIIK